MCHVSTATPLRTRYKLAREANQKIEHWSLGKASVFVNNHLNETCWAERVSVLSRNFAFQTKMSMRRSLFTNFIPW